MQQTKQFGILCVCVCAYGVISFYANMSLAIRYVDRRCRLRSDGNLLRMSYILVIWLSKKKKNTSMASIAGDVLVPWCNDIFIPLTEAEV